MADNITCIIKFKAKEGKDYDKHVVPVQEKLVNHTSGEDGLITYGFARSSSDPNSFLCRCEYTNTQSFVKHVDGHGPFMKELAQVADRLSVEMVCTEKDFKNEALQDRLKSFPVSWFVLGMRC